MDAMTIKELVAYLQALPDQDKRVVLAYDDGVRGHVALDTIAMVGPWLCFCAAMTPREIEALRREYDETDSEDGAA
jgi:hypothetical protein